MTFVSPPAAGVGLAGDPALEVGAALEAAALELAAPDDEGLDAFSSLEQPATPTTTVAALTTINNPRFTRLLLQAGGSHRSVSGGCQAVSMLERLSYRCLSITAPGGEVFLSLVPGRQQAGIAHFGEARGGRIAAGKAGGG